MVVLGFVLGKAKVKVKEREFMPIGVMVKPLILYYVVLYYIILYIMLYITLCVAMCLHVAYVSHPSPSWL